MLVLSIIKAVDVTPQQPCVDNFVQLLENDELGSFYRELILMGSPQGAVDKVVFLLINNEDSVDGLFTFVTNHLSLSRYLKELLVSTAFAADVQGIQVVVLGGDEETQRVIRGVTSHTAFTFACQQMSPLGLPAAAFMLTQTEGQTDTLVYFYPHNNVPPAELFYYIQQNIKTLSI